MGIARIQRVTIPVTDQALALAFYTRQLGLSLLADRPTPMANGARWLEVGVKGSAPVLVLANWTQMRPGSVRGLMLQSDALEDDCARLREGGVVVEGPKDMPWGRQAVVLDPDGNQIVLMALPS